MIKSSLDKAYELEEKAKKLRQEARENEERDMRKKKEKFKKKNKIDAYRTSDYAGLEVGNLHFYYGYEVTYCLKHNGEEMCDEEDCDLRVWCFTVTKAGKQILCIPEYELGPEVEDVAHGLLLGIGHYLKKII